MQPRATGIDERGSTAAAAARGRGVLEGAFEILAVISRSPDGVGLSELARAAGLPKATAHRQLEQLVGLGAVRRHGSRYYVGNLLARLGQAWQPQPELRRASLEPCRALARLTGSAVGVAVLEGGAIRVVASAGGLAAPAHRMDMADELVVRTAAGRVLLAGRRPAGESPPGFTRPEWKRTCAALANHGAVAVDHQDIMPGVYCVAAAIPLTGAGEVASISALFTERTPAPNVPELVLRAAREATRNLAYQDLPAR